MMDRYYSELLVIRYKFTTRTKGLMRVVGDNPKEARAISPEQQTPVQLP
jgi:hypothetical protein